VKASRKPRKPETRKIPQELHNLREETNLDAQRRSLRSTSSLKIVICANNADRSPELDIGAVDRNALHLAQYSFIKEYHDTSNHASPS
jgi:hypothetical protein